MRKYYTTINIENENFVATIYDANTNQEVYKSKPSASQSKAMQEVNSFLTNQKPKQTQQAANIPQTIVNTTVHHPVPTAPVRRCCGR